MSATGLPPLAGVRVVEFAGLGPAPFAAMVMADLGAEVLRIERPDAPLRPGDILNRGRATMAVDLKDAGAIVQLRKILDAADVVIEGMRPGVMERLALGPDELCGSNPRLIYLRMTGWGQTGPLAQAAGHDINYIAISGALAPLGPPDAPPPPPLNLVGDFGGGALYAALGVVTALYERERSGRGQVIDAAMVDGSASLLAMYLSHMQGSRGGTGTARGSYFLDGSAPFYRCYACADGEYVAVGAIEPKFWRALLDGLGIAETLSQTPENWPETARRLEAIFLGRTRDEWADAFAGTDACVTPVLRHDELAANPHLAARGTYLIEDGLLQPAPAPRFSRTPGRIAGEARPDGAAIAAKWLATAAGV
jgi:alpha-methylacyl-CoA racemase